jgi:hypothetical protein
MPNSYDEWYEAIRESDDVSFEDLTNVSAEELGRATEETGFSPEQQEAIAEQQKSEDLEDAASRNTVTTSRQSSIDEQEAYRPSDAEDTIVNIKGDKPDISADRIEGSYTYNGTKFVRVDGKVYGAVKDE